MKNEVNDKILLVAIESLYNVFHKMATVHSKNLKGALESNIHSQVN